MAKALIPADDILRRALELLDQHAAAMKNAAGFKAGGDLVFDHCAVEWMADWMRWHWAAVSTRAWDAAMTKATKIVKRYDHIVAFEKLLADEGTTILKFFLHISKDEQKERQLERIDDPRKNWKFNARDVVERAHWDDYMAAYEEAIRATAGPLRTDRA